LLNLGEKQPTVVMNKVKLSDHAFNRVKERFDITDKNQSLKRVKKIVAQGTYLGKIADKEGIEGNLYAHNQDMVSLADDGTIKTVMKRESFTYDPLKIKFLDICAKEMRKLNRRENATKRKLKNFTFDYNLEVAELERRSHRTRSHNVKMGCRSRRIVLDNEMNLLKQKITNIQNEKRKIAYSTANML
jgi:hypothetical protein